MIKEIYEYYIYKIGRFYKEKLKAENPCYYAASIFFLEVASVVLSILYIIFHLLDIEFKTSWIYLITAVIIMFGVFITDEEIYQTVADKYSNEKHSKLKGWLVFISLIGSFAIWILLCWYFHN